METALLGWSRKVFLALAVVALTGATATLSRSFLAQTSAPQCNDGIDNDGDQTADVRGTVLRTDGIGLLDPTSMTFYLRNSLSTGVANSMASFGMAGAKPVIGDWDGDGAVTIGLYNQAEAKFYLRNSNTTGVADQEVSFGTPNAGWLPVAGDWDGNGTETIGLYNPRTSKFFLRNSNTTGTADLEIGFGTPLAGWLPVAGDWDGNGTETIGLYNAKKSTFYLRNSNTSGEADLTVAFGAANSGWLPVVGDWDGNRTTTIGVYDPATSWFHLRNSNTSGTADISFGYGAPNWLPVSGKWRTMDRDPQCLSAMDTSESPFCGDSVIEAPEACDDGNQNGNDGCSATCVLEAGWACPGAPSTCVSSCSDGIVVGAEQCDDKNVISGDGCSSTCTLESGWTCGGSPSVCQKLCGNGVPDSNELCDDRNIISGDGCSAACAPEAGWACSGVPSTCVPSCGDGIVVGAEQCDDKNAVENDGCSSACTTTCGDGIRMGDESCDDKNTASGDGCSSTCVVEGGWLCTESSSTATSCKPFMQCTDGVDNDGDGKIDAANAWAGKIGVYDPAGVFYLGYSRGMGAVTLPLGRTGQRSIAGDWNGDGLETPGLYDPATSTFSLWDSLAGGNPNMTFGFGTPNTGLTPLAGDWDGDGKDSIGLFDPKALTFYLRNTNSSGNADLQFPYSFPGAIAIAGDWDKDGKDTIGVYDPVTSWFHLRNSNTTGYADIMFGYGDPGAGWTPTAGDWDSDGTDTVGLYDSKTSVFYLENTNKMGYADYAFGFGSPGRSFQPLSGTWVRTTPDPECVSPLDVSESILCGDSQKEGTEQCDDGNMKAGDGCSVACVIESGWVCSGVPSVCVRSASSSSSSVQNPPVTVMGRLLDAVSNAPIVNAFVTSPLPFMPADAKTDNDGKFQFTVDPSVTTAQQVFAYLNKDCHRAVYIGVYAGPGRSEVYVDIAQAAQDRYGISFPKGSAQVNVGDIKMAAAACSSSSSLPASSSSLSSSSLPASSSSSSSSSIAPICGNGIIQGNEQCDDGNIAASDGCSTTCTVETGWVCNGTPSVCGSLCGDGIRIGQDAGFNGSTSYIDAPDSASLDLSSGMTIDLWLKLNGDFSEDWTYVVLKGSDTADASRAYGILGHKFPEGNRLAFGFFDANGADNGIWSSVIQTNRWYHIVGTYGKTAPAPNMKLLIDGAIVATANATTVGIRTNNERLLIGKWRDPYNENFNGEIEDLKIFADAAGSQLVASYAFDGNADDASGYGNNGTNHGAVFTTGTEQCDDHNTTPGDGCSAACTVETGFTCTQSGSLSICSPNPTSSSSSSIAVECGDGTIQADELCDDGNTIANDGCSGTCTVETGWVCNTICPNPQVSGFWGFFRNVVASLLGDVLGPIAQTGPPTDCHSQCAAVCGDSMVKGVEECDDGNIISGDGCSERCAEEECGNGFLETTVGTSAMRTTNAVIRQYLGTIDLDADGNGTEDALSDGILFQRYMLGQTGATLVNGATGSGATRTTGAQVAAFIYGQNQGRTYDIDGDNLLVVERDGHIIMRFLFDPQSTESLIGEDCDDDDTDSGDGCSATCTVETGFTCTQSGSLSICSPNPASSSSSAAPVCGNGTLETGEECDEGTSNGTEDSTCNSLCQPHTCHDSDGEDSFTVGTVTADGEDTVDTCLQVQSSTGGTLYYSVSQCSGTGCAVAEYVCTEGTRRLHSTVVPCGFGCDSGACLHAPSSSSASSSASECGDGVITGDEGCDDDSTEAGDGCSAICTVETGWVCDGSPSVCATICGDGIKTGAEECDDHNTADEDGCSATCTFETGFTCTQSGSLSICSPNPASSSSSSIPCTSTGVIMPVALGHTCCDGLTGTTTFKTPDDNGVCLPLASGALCLPCGNGVCDDDLGEGFCNCPQDCHISSSSSSSSSEESSSSVSSGSSSSEESSSSEASSSIAPMVAVTVLEPNGGESFKLGQPNTIRWSGGSGWVMIGLVDHQFDTDRNMILGWITRESSPDDSITWGGEEVCAADMKTCWKVKELSPGPYRVIVVSRNAAGVVCIDSQEDDCNLDVSDNGFTLVDSCGDGLLATSVGPSATRVKASEVRQYLGMIDLDLDGNGTQEALSDGLLLNRYMSGMTGATLVNGVIGSGATRTTPGEILAFIGSHLEDYYDIDGNGSLEADYDGEIALRYLFDPQVPTLIGEECDDSNVIDGDGCSATCTVETGWMCYVECGTTGTSSEGPLASLRSFFASLFSFVRAQLTGSGSTTEPEQCRSVCAPFCGDGLCMTVEDTSCTRCDGTNDSCDESCYACPEDCGIPSACIEEGKEGSGLTNDACCEDLISVSNAQRDSEGDCAVNEDGSFLCTLCGDGVCGLGENACNCPHDCLNLPIAPCGDGWVDTEVSEECDDGNDGNGDGCSVYCMIENGWECNPDEAGQSECASIFGDGLITGTEECDDANTTDGDGCTLGMIDDGWECAGEPSECTEIPQVAECGNSVVEEGEECDDGNDTENDGCNSCSQEHGWVCSESGSLSICATECGDGKKAGEEQCDDSNSVNGDGCSSSCAREVGFECAPDVEPSLCTSTCGDGIKVGTEECDDDNNDDGDGCNSACRSETCTDSDSGKVLSVKGTTVTGPNGSGSFVTQVDYCGEDGMIGEYSCSGSTIVLEEQSCPTESVCGDGACIPPPEATLTITAVTSTQTQLLGGTLGKAALQLKLKAGNLGDSGNTVRIDTIGFNVITNDGRPHPSVAEAQIFRKGGTEPIAHATAAACGSGSNFMLCADLSQTGLSLTETAGDILSVRVLANSDEQTSSHQVFQLGLPPDGIEASEVRAGNSVPLSINDGNGAAAGEILVFPSDRLVNPATKNKTVYGTIQYPVYAKVLSITDANEDADNTALSAGAKDVAAFTFSAAANVNTKDGLNVIALSGAYFNVVTANVTVNADSLQFYNSAAPDVVRSCRAYSKTGTQLTGEISGSFLAYCNLRDGVLDTQIEQGTSSTFKLRVTILNPKVDDAKSSQLIVSLRQFNKPGLSFGTTGSHLLWEDADQGSATSFRWAEDSLGYVESTRYFFN